MFSIIKPAWVNTKNNTFGIRYLVRERDFGTSLTPKGTFRDLRTTINTNGKFGIKAISLWLCTPLYLTKTNKNPPSEYFDCVSTKQGSQNRLKSDSNLLSIGKGVF